MRDKLKFLVFASWISNCAIADIVNELTLAGFYQKSHANHESLISKTTAKSKLAVNYNFAVNGINTNTLFQLDSDSEVKTVISKEIYYQMSVGTNLEYEVGKIITSRAVGYIFNPLANVMQIKDESTDLAVLETEGVLQVGLTHINNSGANKFTLYKPETKFFYESKKHAFNYYGNIFGQDNDWYWQLDAQNGGNLSASLALSQVLSDATTLNLATTWFNNGVDYTFKQSPSPDPTDRVLQSQSEQIHNLSLLSLSYTTEANIELILEVWHDGKVPNDKFWQGFTEFAHRDNLSFGLPPEIAQLLNANNHLYQDNYLLRVNYEVQDNWEFTAWITKSLAADNTITNFKTEYSGIKDIKLNLGVDCFGGGTKSLHRVLPDKSKIYLNFILDVT